MAKVEVDEEEFLVNKRVRDALAKIAADPKARLKLQEAHKMVDPNAKTPELDTMAPVNEQLTAMQKRLDDAEKKAADEKAEREKQDKLNALQGTVAAGLNRLRQDGWTDEGIKAVEKIMEERGIIDPEIAAAYHEKLHPPQAPITPSGSGAWNFMEMPKEGDDDLKRLIETKGESTPLLDKMVRDTLSEVRTPTRR
jgi:hypothetical protein